LRCCFGRFQHPLVSVRAPSLCSRFSVRGFGPWFRSLLPARVLGSWSRSLLPVRALVFDSWSSFVVSVPSPSPCSRFRFVVFVRGFGPCSEPVLSALGSWSSFVVSIPAPSPCSRFSVRGLGPGGTSDNSPALLTPGSLRRYGTASRRDA
jgi:hypothetical protein